MYLYALLAYLGVLVVLGLYTARRAKTGDDFLVAGRTLPWHVLGVRFTDRIGSDVLEALDGVAASTGSACHSGRRELSPVLKAMAVPEAIGLGAVRFSLGRATTTEELEHVLSLFRTTVLGRKAR